MSATRLLTPDDAPRLAELLHANLDFLAPYEPDRDDAYYTVDGQRAVIEKALDEHAAGVRLPHAILDEKGCMVGRITLNEILRGPAQWCSLGYWLDEAHTRRGLATKAVEHIKGLAFGELGLHRIQAGTLTDNVRSQRVLERTGFVRYGLAPQYLKIAGRWQDHVLYQVLSSD